MFPLVAIIFLGYFLLLRPFRKQEQDHKKMLAAVKKNDRVITQGGLIGVVHTIKDDDDEVTLKVDDNVRLRVTKQSIVRVVPSGGEAAKDAKS